MTQALGDLHIRLSEIGRAGRHFEFRPDAADLGFMAKTLGLVALPVFEATLDVALWLDGAEITGVWSGVVTQNCGVSLEDFDTTLSGRFVVRVVPQDSPNAPNTHLEVDLDAEAEDPPDVLESDQVDLAGFVVEHLALELDPFPRKPGALFEPPEPSAVVSPFAALRDLKS